MTKENIIKAIAELQAIQGANPPSSTAWQEASRKLQPLFAQMQKMEKLAREFSKIIGEWLTADQLADLLILNMTSQDKSICHTHDFCDANMAMLGACENLGITCFIDLDENDPAREESLDLINGAWDLAKENNFYVGDDQDQASRKMWN